MSDKSRVQLLKPISWVILEDPPVKALQYKKEFIPKFAMNKLEKITKIF